jgi:hypothetical protein
LQDTPTVSTEDLTSIQNTNVSISPQDDARVSPMTETSHLQPLISPDRKKPVSPKHTSDSKNSSPNRPLSGAIGDTNRPLGIENNSKRPVSNDEDDIGFADDETCTNPRMALLGKKAASNLSLDSYDKTKNPFFADE